ncbi:MAG TPA: heparinase II/III family protein [Dermatophilaceae bacterium]|nr:heparinase II/III family protein [Dermatophilaceae bacterium]
MTGVTAGASNSRYPCTGYAGMELWNPTRQVVTDHYRWGTYPVVRVGDGSGNINWRLDPFRQPSWHAILHSLRWLGQPIREWRANPSANAPQIAHVTTIVRDWIRDNPYPWGSAVGAGSATMYRTNTLLCLREAVVEVEGSAPAWLDASLVQHSSWLRANEWLDHNIGTDRNLALLGIGCVLDRPADRDLAVARLATAIGRVVDAQGANNEQSPGYADWNHTLWGKVDRAVEACHVDTAAAEIIPAKRSALQSFLDRSTGPDGRLSPLGDTSNAARLDPSRSSAQRWLASNGRAGQPPTDRVQIYRAGYVFGRSGWGTGSSRLSSPAAQSAYSIRFGAVRAGHGHHDHMSVTWTAAGQPVLVDPGFGEYTWDAWRRYAISAPAHNMVLVGSQTTTPATSLVRSRVRPGGDFFELRDTVGRSSVRRRSVLVMSNPEVMLVYDRVANPPRSTTFSQLWHLPPGLRATSLKGGVVTNPGSQGRRTWILQVPLTSRFSPAVARVIRGSTRPVQGWYWSDNAHRWAAPVVSLTRSGRSAAFLTAVVADPASRVNVTRIAGSRSIAKYLLRIGSRNVRVSVSSDGTLTRLG